MLSNVLDEHDDESRRGKRNLDDDNDNNNEGDAPRKRQRITRVENSPSLFRNVRWTLELITPEVLLESSDLKYVYNSWYATVW